MAKHDGPVAVDSDAKEKKTQEAKAQNAAKVISSDPIQEGDEKGDDGKDAEPTVNLEITPSLVATLERLLLTGLQGLEQKSEKADAEMAVPNETLVHFQLNRLSLQV